MFEATPPKTFRGPIFDAFEVLAKTEWAPIVTTARGMMVRDQICALLDRPDALNTFYPPAAEVFNTFLHVPPKCVKVVLFGQDPYPKGTFAHGLCFSCRRGSGIANSIRVITNGLRAIEPTYPELAHASLECWEQQGVLLVNSALTVRKGDAGLAKDPNATQVHLYCWRPFLKLVTDYLQELENERVKQCMLEGMVPPRVIYLGVGKSGTEIVESLSAVHRLTTGHPSFSHLHGKFDASVFVQVNAYLIQMRQPGIDWRVV